MSVEEKWSCVLTNKVYGLGLAWDKAPGQMPLDLDLQAVIVDANGQIVDAVYFNNSYALKGAVQMANDQTTGESEGLDESIWVKINQLPESIKMVIFVVAAYSGGCLADAENGVLRICEGDLYHVVKEFPIEHSCAQADMVAMLLRDAQGIWTLQELTEPAENGSHFIDILEPMIGDHIRKFIKGAPAYQTVSFQMGKGSVVDLPHASALKRAIIAIGGEMPKDCDADADIDVSAVFFSASGKALGAVDSDRLQMFGFRHTGDGSAGSSELDDEAIGVTMDEIPDCVSQIFILMTVKDGTFKNVAMAYARVTDHLCTDLARFEFQGGIDEQGLVIGRFFRSPSRRWGFQAYGSFCKGPTWKEAQPELQALFSTPPHIASGVRRTLDDKGNPPVSGAKSEKPAAKKRAPKVAKEVSEAPPQEGTAEANAAKKQAGENPAPKKKAAAKPREAAPEVAGTEETSNTPAEVKEESQRPRNTELRSWKPSSDVPASCQTSQRNLNVSGLDSTGISSRTGGKKLTFRHSKLRQTFKAAPMDAEQTEAAAAPVESNELGPEERPVDERREIEEKPAPPCSWMCSRGRLW